MCLQRLDSRAVVAEVLQCLRTATQAAPNWSKAWHQWALFNVAVMLVRDTHTHSHTHEYAHRQTHTYTASASCAHRPSIFDGGRACIYALYAVTLTLAFHFACTLVVEATAHTYMLSSALIYTYMLSTLAQA